MGKYKLTLKLSQNDIECLKFIWKWKLCTTALLKHTIYKEKTYYRTYRRLRDLDHAKLVRTLASVDGKNFVWTLAEKGLGVLDQYLPELKSQGYKSENRDHDFWVTAVHLGEWSTGIPKNCALFSEQQLRHFGFAAYPDWVPKTSSHRPDGWWNISLGQPQQQSLVALEVEISRKTPLRYKEIGLYYSKTVKPYQVIWVVANNKEMNFIESKIKEGSLSHGSEQSFLTLNQYIEKQWQSRIEKGKNQGKTLLDILGSPRERDSKELSGVFSLNTRKCPTVSTSHDLVKLRQLGLSRDL